MARNFYIQYDVYRDSFAFQIREGQHLAEPTTFKEREPGEYVPPMMDLSSDDCQILFNQLWQAGFRPKDGSGNIGHIAAIQYHLEDMRKLVFAEPVIVNEQRKLS
jgi:hypothetical protein